MRTKLLLLLLNLFIASANILAQDQELFKVLASKGTIKYTSGSSTESKPIVIGKKLYKNDQIVVGTNSYLGLVHTSGKTIEVKKPGTYKVSELSSEVTTQNSSVSKKYVDFVMGEMTSNNEDMTQNRHKYMGVTGSVERGGSSIKLLAPNEAYALETTVLLSWYPVKDAKQYVVKVRNMFDEYLYQTETSETSITVDLGKLNLKEEKNLIWSVEIKGNADAKAEASLKYPSAEKVELVNQQIKEIKSDLSEESALNKIVLASFYEKNQLLLYALENYQSAIKLEPEVEDFKVAYGRFLSRNGLENDSSK